MTFGYYQCPQFSTLAEARKFLGELVQENMATVRRRYGQATKVRNYEDNYTILIGGPSSVSRWSTHWIHTT
jgi:2-phosphoglycerate kinase